MAKKNDSIIEVIKDAVRVVFDEKVEELGLVTREDIKHFDAIADLQKIHPNSHHPVFT